MSALGSGTVVIALLAAGCASRGRASDWHAGEVAPGSGTVLAVGGGGTPRAVIREALRRVDAGGRVDVVVVPYASQREDRGVGSAEMWREEGADSASVAPVDRDLAAEMIRGAEVIWLGGGDQYRLLDDLLRMDLLDDIQAAHRRGALVGGTSAGAAVLGSVCIAGSPDPEPYVRGAMVGRPGLGLIKNAIIDQHFRERKREGRLLTAVLDAGPVVGYGVSESTALFFGSGGLSVMGEGVVVVFDAIRLHEPDSDASISTRLLRPSTAAPAKASRRPQP